MFLIRFCNKIRSYTNSSAHIASQNASNTRYILHNYYTENVPFLVSYVIMNINTHLDYKGIFPKAQMPVRIHNSLTISASVDMKKR